MPRLDRVALDHVAIGLERIADALPFLLGELGGRPAGGGLARAFRFRQWTFGGGKLELLEPHGPPGGFLHRFLERRGAGVHHVTFEVPSLAAACDRAEGLGFAVVERDESDPGWKEAFLHPKSALGIVIQLAERADSEADDESRQAPAPEPGDPEPGPPGIELVGLRLAAADLERARRLYCDLLGARPAGGPAGGPAEELDLRWPGSSLRLLLRAGGPGEPEGPRAIELACLRPALLPRGRHPVLGAVFEPVDITELPPPPSEVGESPNHAGGAPAGAPVEAGAGGQLPAEGTTGSDQDGEPVWFLDGDELGESS